MKNSKEKSPAERGETFSVPNYGIANTDPMDMTKRNFEAWMAVQSEGPAKDAIRAARDKKEAWVRRELEKLSQPPNNGLISPLGSRSAVCKFPLDIPERIRKTTRHA